MVPGLLRARRRQRPGQRGDQGRARRRRVGGHRAEGLDLAGAPGGLVLRGVPDRPRARRATRASRTCSCRWTSRGSRCGRSSSSRGPRSSTRCSSTGPAPRSTTSWARSATGGGSPWPPWPSSAAWPCSATSSRSAGSSTAWSPWPGRTARPTDPVVRQRLARPTSSWRIMRYNTLRSLSGVDGPVAPPRPPSPSCTGGPGTGGSASWPWTSWDRRPPSWTASRCPERRVRARRAPALLPLRPRRDHLRRVQRDPAQHHRRAGPRPAARAKRGGVSTSLDASFDPPPPPPPPAGHGLLEGKVVIVTAAAGTGIGFATARRCLEEGAAVVVSDAHERRLAETAEQLAGELGAEDAAGARARLRRARRGAGQRALRRRRSTGSAASTWRCTTPGWGARCRWST